MTAKLSCLLIKIPATNSQDPNSMAKFLESVHRILPSGSTISFEIVSRNNILHYFITVVKEYQKYIESQLYANYQDIEITQTSDWFSFFENPIIKEIKFSKKSFLPLITFNDLKDDPLNSLSTYIEKLGKNEMMFIQLTLKRKSDHDMVKELKGSLFFLSNPRYGKDGKVSPGFNKYGQHMFAGRLRIGFSSDKTINSRNQLEIIGNNYKQIIGPSNKLTPVSWNFWHSNKKLIAVTRKRQVFLKHDYWTSAEIATIYHFPYTQSTTANIVQTTSRKAPAPSMLPRELYVK